MIKSLIKLLLFSSALSSCMASGSGSKEAYACWKIVHGNEGRSAFIERFTQLGRAHGLTTLMEPVQGVEFTNGIGVVGLIIYGPPNYGDIVALFQMGKFSSNLTEYLNGGADGSKNVQTCGELGIPAPVTVSSTKRPPPINTKAEI